MINLSALEVSAPSPIPVDDLVAAPMYAPADWQSSTPDDVFEGHRAAVLGSEDLRRILMLARREPPEEDTPQSVALVELAHKKYRTNDGTRPCKCAAIYAARGVRPRPCITTLRHVQAWALFELEYRGGLLGLVGVGHGKTLLDLFAALALESRTAVLLVPPTLVEQLVNDHEIAAQHWRVPSLVVHHERGISRDHGGPQLHVLPYSKLSRADAAMKLAQIAPDAIIADEAHKISRPDTATTARVVRYLHENRRCRFAGWSGSITSDTIKQYAHLAAFALRKGSPLPLDPDTVEDWARCLDPSDNPAPPGALLDLCSPGEHVYDGFRRRLTETRGIVHTTTSAINAELVIEERSIADIPEAITMALGHLRQTWQRPDGEELVDALSMTRCAREIAAGFFYRWIFPNGEPVEIIVEWLVARAAWNKELRGILKQRLERMDSELLCRRAAQRAHADIPTELGDPIWPSIHWPRWRDIAMKVRPETEAVRIDDYLVQDASRWALEHRGIVWYESAEFGKWLAEVSGLPLHGGGPDAGKRIAAERGDRSIVASLKSHGTGRDGLQHLYSAQLFAQPPSSPTTWEQSLGRLHRIGQDAPIVHAVFYRHTDELRNHVDSALRKAKYVLGTTGARQKILDGMRG